jgi:hypothetical protein
MGMLVSFRAILMAGANLGVMTQVYINQMADAVEASIPA